jgi:hypothetical protein
MAKALLIFQILILGTLLNNGQQVFAQSTTLLSYDANGNRIRKQLVGSSPHPTVTASPEAVNPNQPSTLVASGCPGTVQWLPVNQTGSQITVNPTATTQYTAQCVVNGCANKGFAKTTVTLIQCTTVQLSAAVSATAVKYGQQVSLYAFGCNTGTVTWSTGEVGTPVNTAVYGQSTIYTATCGSANCPNLGSASVTVAGTIGCSVKWKDIWVTKQSGNWNDPNTWYCGAIPPSNCIPAVYIPNGHVITLTTETPYKTIISGGGYIKLENGGYFKSPPDGTTVICLQ